MTQPSTQEQTGQPKTEAGLKSQKAVRPQPTNFDKEPSKIAATVGVPREAAYLFFRDLENLPSFMKDLKSIEVISETRSRWTVEIKGISATWEAEITQDIPGEMIAWESVEGSEIQTQGAIWFRTAPENLGTILNLELEYKVPGGKLTELVTALSGESPAALAFTNLRRLKCLLETGEIATIEGQPSGRDQDATLIEKH
ncbi:MAG: SRPBCC family protein [Bdellovibrionaceae bacterium]|nr:SRPBCC family protein [Pseudobdellovibrionaceae bacterium]